MSDGINILFGKGPFDRLRDRGSFATVSELASGEPAEPVDLTPFVLSLKVQME